MDWPHPGEDDLNQLPAESSKENPRSGRTEAALNIRLPEAKPGFPVNNCTLASAVHRVWTRRYSSIAPLHAACRHVWGSCASQDKRCQQRGWVFWSACVLSLFPQEGVAGCGASFGAPSYAPNGLWNQPRDGQLQCSWELNSEVNTRKGLGQHLREEKPGVP